MRLNPAYALFLSLGMLASGSTLVVGCSSSPSVDSASADSTSADSTSQAPDSMPMGGDMPMGDHMMNMDLGPKDAEFDLRFIDGMMVHHQGAVTMAEAALQNSQRPEIKQLAQGIIAAQQKEIEQMQEWRQAWYPDASTEPIMYHAQMGHSMPMSGEMQASMRMDGDLGAADDKFDLRFLDGMIPHHEGALVMAEQVLKNSDRPELKQLANDILTSQQTEIEQMTQWKKDWYGL
jgi:uncharacterized protein (DUF305 family)